MSESRVMDVDPDRLFEQHTIPDVETLLLNINNEIERKKVELRTIVGERYRDLIDTADTISQMKSISEHFIKEVQIMNSDMGNLKLKQVPFTKTADNLRGKKRSLIRSVEDSIAAQVSVLVDLPELIWNAISAEDFVKAAQLYLLARHIKTGFSVDENLSRCSSRFPVIDQQWKALAHFQQTILGAAESRLLSLEISSEEACTCLCAMALLDNKDLPGRLLSLRLQTIHNCLESEQNVKASILESHNAIVKSLSILWDCFATENYSKQLFWKRLTQVADASSPPVVRLLEKSIRLKYLPPIILQFRATSLYSASSFDMEALSPQVSEWIGRCRQLATSKGQLLLIRVVSLPSLESLTNLQISSSRDWDHLLDSFKVPARFELWTEVYKPLISSRARELTSEQCEEAFTEVVTCLESATSTSLQSESDTDLRWFVWSESPHDLELDPITNTRGLLLKAMGITPKVGEICKKFEKSLSVLSADLSGLYSSDVTLQADQAQLKAHQQKAYLRLLLRLKEYIRGVIVKESVGERELSLLARFLSALLHLTPSLHKTLSASSTDNKESPWEEAKVLLETEGLAVWSRWEEKAAGRLGALVPIHLKKPDTYADLLNIIPNWSTAWIVEDGGGGEEDSEKKHKSQLKVPSAPSFPLQTLLHAICTDLASAHLPRVVSENVMQRLMPTLVACYGTAAPLCQAESLQQLFDLKYLLAMFVPITHKELSTLCQEKISQIEGNIDPFDLDVFSSYIAANVKSSVHRTQLLFGICSMFKSGASWSDERPQETEGERGQTEDLSTLALNNNASSVWFPLIPLTSVLSSKSLHLHKSKAMKTVAKPEPEVATTAEPTKALSSSFLSDWFG